MKTTTLLAAGALLVAAFARAQEIMPTPVPTPPPTMTPTPSPTPWEITPGATAATASTHDGNVAANTVDNRLTTRWSGYGDGAWLRLDLGASRKVGQLRVAAYRGNERRNRFEIQLSGAGSTWRSVFTGETSGTTTELATFDFPAQYARYVRYLGHGSVATADGTTGLWNSVTELDVFGWMETPTSPPAAPTSLRASPAAGRVTLTWSGPAPQFRVWRRASQCDSYVVVGMTDGALSFVDTTVIDRRHYYYAVTAVNSVGESPASAPVAVTPQLQPPGAPTVQASNGPMDSGQVHLAWAAVPTATRYTIKRGPPPNACFTAPLVAIASADAPSTSYTDATAQPGTRYAYAVSASNVTGEGPNSTNVIVTPPSSVPPPITPTPTPCPGAPVPPPILEPPLPPASLAAEEADQRAQLTWSPQGSIYSRPTGYGVFRGPDTCGPYSQIAYHVPYGRFGDEPLVNGQTYHYFVVARNPLGESFDSPPASASPQQVPPVKPNVQVVTNVPSNGAPWIRLSWAAAFANDRYLVRRSTTSGGPYTTLATVPRPADQWASYEDKSVASGQEYFYVVTAENSLGSISSDERRAQTGISAPTGLRAKGVAGGIELAWSAVGGASGYHVKRRTTCGTSFTTIATAASASYTDVLSASSRQFYVVSARAGTAESVDSSETGASPFVAAPSPPSDVRAANVTAAEITLAWSAVAEATGYRVFRRHGGSGSGCNNDPFELAGTVTDGATSYTDRMVSPGTLYEYQVRSARDARQGPPSAKLDVVTAGARGWPHSPLGHCFPPPTPTPVPTGAPWPPSIQWHVASHRLIRMTLGGSGDAAKLNLYRSRTSCGPFELVHETTNTQSPLFSDPDLTNDQTYTYLYVGENSFGEGRWSTTWDTPRAVPPSTPTTTRGIPGDGQARLEWSPSYSATSYVVKRSSGGEFGPYAPIGTTTTDSFVDTGLTNGVRYHYVIHPVNEHGESVHGSARITVMPVSPDLPPPTGVTATAFASTSTGPGFIRVQWQSPPGADSFNILRRADDEPTFEHIATTPYTVFQETRIFNIRYHYYVVAKNAFGASSGPSATVSAILPTPTTAEVTPPASRVTASTHDGNLPGNTVDSNLATRWSAPSAGGEVWLEMDLGAVRTVTNVRVAVYRGDTRKNSFAVMTSRDRVNWDLQWSGYSRGTSTALETFDIMDASARYVRYVGSGALANGTSEQIYWNSVTEMEVFAVP